MNDRPTLTERAKFYLDRSNVEPKTDFGIICQGVIELERERDEAREQNAALRDALQTVRDEAFGSSPEKTAMQNIAAIEKGIADMRKENAALRDALRVRIEHCYCPECNVHMEWAKHSKTCRHYQTELEVMAKV